MYVLPFFHFFHFFAFFNAGHFSVLIRRPAQYLHHETRNFSNSSSKNSRLHTMKFTFCCILGQLNNYLANVSKFGRKQTWPQSPRSSWTSPWGCCRRCGLSQDACQPHLLPGTCGQRVSRWASRPVSSLACKCLEFSTNMYSLILVKNTMSLAKEKIHDFCI